MSTDLETKRDAPKSNDFVIRDGFPALRNAKGEPQIDGVEPLPRAPFLSYSSALSSLGDCLDTLWEDCAMVFSAAVPRMKLQHTVQVVLILSPPP
jgi:hypothetical protein